MAKRKNEADGPAFPAPALVGVGDKVELFPRGTESTEPVPAEVLFVHPNTEGRLLNVRVQSADGSQDVLSVPYHPNDADDIIIHGTWRPVQKA